MIPGARWAVLITALLASGCVTTTTATGLQSVKVPQLPNASERLYSHQPPVVGYMSTPKGTGPFPGVILLHGCAGLQRDTRSADTWNLLVGYADRYTQRGYVAMILDSHGPRGQSDLCAAGSDMVVPYEWRAWDAAAAADFMVKHANVSKDKVVVQGLSSGGASVMYAVEIGPQSPPRGIFAAGIAWYPRCQWWGPAKRFGAPLLILGGGKDDYTPVTECQSIIDRVPPDSPHKVVMRVYPEARHAYDYPGVSGFVGGFRLAYDREATQLSWQEIDAFLTEHVR